MLLQRFKRTLPNTPKGKPFHVRNNFDSTFWFSLSLKTRRSLGGEILRYYHDLGLKPVGKLDGVQLYVL